MINYFSYSFWLLKNIFRLVTITEVFLWVISQMGMCRKHDIQDSLMNKIKDKKLVYLLNNYKFKNYVFEYILTNC